MNSRDHDQKIIFFFILRTKRTDAKDEKRNSNYPTLRATYHCVVSTTIFARLNAIYASTLAWEIDFSSIPQNQAPMTSC